MICKICNITISDHAAFCSVCGTETGAVLVSNPATKKCPQCGAENPLNAKFCRNDGFSFPRPEPEAVPPVEEVKAEGIKCPVCGTLNPESASFCRNDGSLLRPATKEEKQLERETARTETAPVTETVPLKEKKVFGKKIWISFAGVLVLSFVGAYFLFSGTPVNKKTLSTEERTEETGQQGRDTTKKEPEKTRGGSKAEQKTETREREQKKEIDIPRLEGQINRALRKEGLEGVTAEVDDSAVVTLKGVVQSSGDKKKAFETARSFSGVRQVKDIIFVVER